MPNKSIYHYLFRPINLIHNACLLLNFLKKCTRNIFTNGYMFDDVYYQTFQKVTSNIFIRMIPFTTIIKKVTSKNI